MARIFRIPPVIMVGVYELGATVCGLQAERELPEIECSFLRYLRTKAFEFFIFLVCLVQGIVGGRHAGEMRRHDGPAKVGPSLESEPPLFFQELVLFTLLPILRYVGDTVLFSFPAGLAESSRQGHGYQGDE